MGVTTAPPAPSREAGPRLPARLLRLASDERLVAQVRAGSPAAFEEIFDRYHRGILAFCRHMLGSQEEAEDAVQHTFIQAYDSIRRGDRELKLKAWLYTIARNRCLSILRARREQAAELDELPTAGLSAEVQQRADLRELLADVRELPEDQRAALVLSEVGDLSHADIAAVVGCEASKVKSLVFQARSSLIESRNAREIPCHEIREQLATASGGALRRGPLRRHVKQCAGCAEFQADVKRQRRMLAAALPVIPSLALKKSALAAVGIGGGGGAVAASGGGAAGGGLASLLGSGAAGKAVAVVAVAGATVGGGVAITNSADPPARERSAPAQQAAPAAQPGGDIGAPAPDARRRGEGAGERRRNGANPGASRRSERGSERGANRSAPNRGGRRAGGPGAVPGNKGGRGGEHRNPHAQGSPLPAAPPKTPGVNGNGEPLPPSSNGGAGGGNNGQRTGPKGERTSPAAPATGGRSGDARGGPGGAEKPPKAELKPPVALSLAGQ